MRAFQSKLSKSRTDSGVAPSGSIRCHGSRSDGLSQTVAGPLFTRDEDVSGFSYRVWRPFLTLLTRSLWASQRNPLVKGIGPISSLSAIIRMNSSFISSWPQPHLQSISERLKLGVIMLAMKSPVTMRNTRRDSCFSVNIVKTLN